MFRPSRAAFLVVALALLLAALIAAALGGIFRVPIQQLAIEGCAVVLASILVLRSIGDFRLVGFFKCKGDGPFARMDSLLYSPLCLTLGLAVGAIFWTG